METRIEAKRKSQTRFDTGPLWTNHFSVQTIPLATPRGSPSHVPATMQVPGSRISGFEKNMWHRHSCLCLFPFAESGRHRQECLCHTIKARMESLSLRFLQGLDVGFQGASILAFCLELSL